MMLRRAFAPVRSVSTAHALMHITSDPRTVTARVLEMYHPIQNLKIKHLGNRNPRLHTDEILVALSISAVQKRSGAPDSPSIIRPVCSSTIFT